MPSFEACIGMPLEEALSCCRSLDGEMNIVYTGKRAAEAQFTPRVLALRGNTLIAAFFYDGDPKRAEEQE